MKLLALLICLSSFAADSPKPPYISVTGDAEVKATPDQFTVRIRIEGRHKEQTSAREQVESTVQRAVAAAKILGVSEKDIRTLYFQTRRVFGKDGRTASVKSYEVASRMSFVLRDVNKAEELVNALTDAGASSVEGSDFGFENPRKLHDQARSEAVEAATQKASAVARQLGVKLGFPLVVEILPNESSDRFARATMTANSVTMYEAPGIAAGPVIAPGENTIRASVRIEFELLKP
jgi:uncharacterized protein